MHRHLRIALVVNPFHFRLKGGDHAPSMARELLGRGHTVRGFGAPPGVIPRSGSAPSVDGGVAPDEGLGLLGFAPDAIVAYDSLSPAAWHSARMARRLRAALVLVDEGFPTLGRRLERLQRFAGERLWGRYVRRHADAVIALDSVARGQALAKGFPESLVRLTHGGVDLGLFRPGLASDLPARHGVRGRIVLHVGRIDEGRGLELLIEAFAATVGRRSDWSLVFAGDGARGALRAAADRLGIGSRVFWIGRPRSEELPGLFASSTLLAVPALDDDVSGVKIARAQACGLPVLAADVERLTGTVEHEATGLVVRAGDRAAWVAALQNAAGAPERRRRWGLEARARAEREYSWPIVAERFEGILRGAIDRQPRPATGGIAVGREP